jgi:hypothetical protein
MTRLTADLFPRRGRHPNRKTSEYSAGAIARLAKCIHGAVRSPLHDRRAAAVSAAVICPGSGPRLPAGAPIDQLAENVGMPGMAGRLLQQVHQHPAKRHRRICFRASA